MADYQAVYAVGDAIVKFLTNSYASSGVGLPCTFQLASSQEIATNDTADLNQSVVIYLHRITRDESFRYVTQLQDQPNDQPILYLDLHYLVSYWDTTAASAEAEQSLVVWTMQQLQSSPILDTSILSLSQTNPGWDKTDAIQIIPADLTLQEIMDIWEGLGSKYRLTVGYVARVVRIDRSITPGTPVVATRFQMQMGGAN